MQIQSTAVFGKVSAFTKATCPPKKLKIKTRKRKSDVCCYGDLMSWGLL